MQIYLVWMGQERLQNHFLLRQFIEHRLRINELFVVVRTLLRKRSALRRSPEGRQTRGTPETRLKQLEEQRKFISYSKS